MFFFFTPFALTLMHENTIYCSFKNMNSERFRQDIGLVTSPSIYFHALTFLNSYSHTQSPTELLRKLVLVAKEI
jgi:hypothetical protein